LALAHGAIAAGEALPSSWGYGNRGLEWSDPASGTHLWLGLRMQARYSSNLGSLLLLEDFDQPQDSGGRINRARYKIGAGIGDRLTIYHEYDLRNSLLLDLRSTWTPSDSFQLRVGQWKSPFSRERIDSSGAQQFVDRSIANYYFTVDRQWGMVASGKVASRGSTGSQWWFGALAGNGRNESYGSGPPMWLGRWQWNYGSGGVPFSQSALKRYGEPRGSLALAFIVNDSPFTRYSSSGGGQLPGYEPGSANNYHIRQLLQEWAYQHRGLSLQQELHWKSVEKGDSGELRELYGGYFQSGWFPADRWETLPQQWELAVRVAYVDLGFEGLSNAELTFGSNWFFNGHRNKLTAELSRQRTLDEDTDEERSDWIFRIQWDISI
jgi:hypothetical protein